MGIAEDNSKTIIFEDNGDRKRAISPAFQTGLIFT
jgi:hypothetical protein